MSDAPDLRELDRSVEGAAAAHQRLLGHLDELVEERPGVTHEPSLLPGWTVGHVITHLARNADSHRRMIEAAGRGEVADQYPGGTEQRAREIDEGASRLLPEQITDLRRAIWALEGSWSTATAQAWRGEGRTLRGRMPIADLPFRRWREVEVHHSDLGLGFTPEDWSAAYVRLELRRREMAWRARTPMGLGALPQRALELSPPLRLAWLLGRHQAEGLPTIDDW